MIFNPLHLRKLSAAAGAICFFISLLSPSITPAQTGRPGVGLHLNSPDFSAKYLIHKKPSSRYSIAGYTPGPVPRTLNLQVEIDALDSYVVIRETVNGEDIKPPVALTLGQYQSILAEQKMSSAWQEYVLSDITEGDFGASGTRGINLEIPVKIKSKAFKQIFGSGTVGLQVTGDISIKAALRRENRSEVRDALTRGSNTNFNMEQKQRFQVTGKIGDKVTVNVDQDSERAFDFDNNVRIQYQGYDDEIIQRIEAGNISLTLPGTRYVTFSGKSSGLFGIKSEMVLGDLNVTAIASQEKGESQKLSLSGGASQGSRRIEDYNYLSDTYFFIDGIYRENYKRFDSNFNHIAVSVSEAVNQESFEVYKAAPLYETEFPDKSFPAWAVFAYPENRAISPADTGGIKAGEVEFGHFIRLERSEYVLEPDLGYLRMNNSVSDDEILAVSYRKNSGIVFGDTLNNQLRVLKLIKPRNPQPSYPTWDLMWKHVYSISGRNLDLDGLEVEMYFKKSSGPDQEVSDDGEHWLTIFGVDNKDTGGLPEPDGEIDLDNNIINRFYGEIHFPDLEPFDPEGYTVNGNLIQRPVDPDLTVPAIYDTTSESFINSTSNFYLDVKTTSRSTEYDLGFNVIEGSELVTLDGQELVRGVDYTIDYFSGQLNILNERASNPSARVDVTYERNQLFQLEKKTILGMRAEYELGRDSFIGGTFLYLNESTLERKVRVGRGPMRNLVWDLNTRLRFTPNFVGNAFNALPLIRARGETKLDFEGEIAQVLPTPNTLNSPSTGDNKGVAYIDDFEGSKRTTSLGVLRKNWSWLSAPAASDSLWTVENMGTFIWYNPFEQVPIKQIYPEQEVNANVAQRTHVLTFELFPDSARTQVNRWGGVMRALSPGFFDQSETKFIEIMVQGNRGRMHVDLGLISEDVIRNNRLDQEDVIVRNNRLEDGEDTGIDGIFKPDPPTRNYSRSNHVGQTRDATPFDFWDINGNNIKDPQEPWSFDDWQYSELDPFIYFRTLQPEGDVLSSSSIDGTERNANDTGGRLPDTEDINKNSIMDPVEAYFSYTFSLEDNHPDTALVVGGNPDPNIRGGPWKLYRIPFTRESASVFGSPSVNQIEFVRIWIDSVDQYAGEFVNFSIADISLVGNEWKDLGTKDTVNDSDITSGLSEDESFEVTVINTFDNPDYIPPDGVEGELDRITNVRAREQALVLKADRLLSGKSGISQKSFFQSENYIHYDRIRMFVYGLDAGIGGRHIPSDQTSQSQVEYFLRLGSDPNNYYEYSSRVFAGWDERNHMDVALQEFTQIDRDLSGGFKKIPYDSTGFRHIAVRGNPSITNVRVLILGVRNLDRSRFSGEVWFNELRLSDVEQDKGRAMRMRADLRIADFAAINGEIEKKDADFHNVATRFGNGDNSLSGNLNATVNVDKMLPQSFGLAMPLTINYRESSSTPKYFPGRDRLVTDDITDEELATVRTESKQTGFNLSLQKQIKSQNFFVKNTLDNMNFSIGRSENNLTSPTLAISKNRTWTGNFDYRLDFGRNNFFSPFAWLPKLPLIEKVQSTRLYYTPQNMSFRMSGNKTDTHRQNRTANSPLNFTEVFDVTRSFRTSMKIFENLSFDFSRTHKADMKDASSSDFLKFNFNDYNIAQNFSARYTPQLVGWLTNNFNYSSNYSFNNNLQQITLGRSARVATTRSADFVFKWKQFAADLFGFGKKETPSRGRGRGRRDPSRRDPRDEGRERNELNIFQEKEEDEGSSFNPLKAVGAFFSSFKDFSFNYSERDNRTQNALTDAGMPTLGFQFGLSDDTGVPSDTNFASVPVILGESRTYNVGSGLALGREVDVALRFEHADQRNVTQQGITGTTANSWLRVGEFDMLFPEWSVRVTGLEKLPLFSKFFRSVSFTHNFSGRKDEGWNTSPENLTQENFTTNFRPLGKLDLNFTNGFTGNIQLNRSITFNRTFNSGIAGASRTTNSDVSLSANYSKRSGFRIPIWPFNKAELKNSIDFSFTFSASTVLTEKSTSLDGSLNEDELEEFDKTTRWLVSPRLTYSFSNQVRGGAFIEFGKTISKLAGTTSFQEFGIDINISIVGR